jgi:hypothetical protein
MKKNVPSSSTRPPERWRGNGGSSGALSGSFLATLRYDPYVSKGLVRDDHARTQWSAGRLSVELIDDTVGEPRNSGKEAPNVAKEQPECFRHRENELPMRQLE